MEKEGGDSWTYLTCLLKRHEGKVGDTLLLLLAPVLVEHSLTFNLLGYSREPRPGPRLVRVVSPGVENQETPTTQQG